MSEVNGRPSLYKPEYDQMLIDHMATGLSFESFAAITDTCKDTLYEWAKVHPSFSDAKKKAVQKCRLFWEKLGVDHILNISETSKSSDGSNYSKSKSLNASIWIFNMKNRFKDEWREKQETEITGKDIKIVIGEDEKDA